MTTEPTTQHAHVGRTADNAAADPTHPSVDVAGRGALPDVLAEQMRRASAHNGNETRNGS